jgi:hypothetical protein
MLSPVPAVRCSPLFRCFFSVPHLRWPPSPHRHLCCADRLCRPLYVCVLQIELPRYTTLEAMTERMRYAMMHSNFIDADGARQHSVIDTDTGADDEPSLF